MTKLSTYNKSYLPFSLLMLFWWCYFSEWCGETLRIVTGRGEGEDLRQRKENSGSSKQSKQSKQKHTPPWMTLPLAHPTTAPTAIAAVQRGMINTPTTPTAPTNRKPDDEVIACQMPNGEHYVFIYNEDTEQQAMKHLGKCAADPSHPLTWHNVAQMTKLMRAARLEREWMREAE